MKRVLFIGHEATRTGAPIVLLSLLRWLKSKDFPYKIDLLLLQGGELEDEYRNLVDNLYLMPQPQFGRKGLLERLINRFKKEFCLAREYPRMAPFDQKYEKVLANTAISLKVLKPFKEKGAKTICWIHELEYSIKELCGLDEFVKASKFVDSFIACSKAVQQMLQKVVTGKEVYLAYDFTEGFREISYEEIEMTKAELGIPKDAFVIGGCGTIHWRKGVDIFIYLARKLSKIQGRNFYFVWLGKKLPSFESERILYDFERIEVNNRIVFAGSQVDVARFFACFDVFALTSREDPFPLVCLEAASLGKPIICFEKAGGMPEFVGSDAGKVVPYGDIDAFCQEIINFHDNPKKLEECGRTARKKLMTDFSAENSCRKICELLLK